MSLTNDVVYVYVWPRVVNKRRHLKIQTMRERSIYRHFNILICADNWFISVRHIYIFRFSLFMYYDSRIGKNVLYL